MKQVLLKTIIIVVDKLIRSRVLQGGASWGPKGQGWGKKFSPSCGAGAKTPSFEPAPPHYHP